MPRCRLMKTLNSFHINGVRMLNKLPLASRDLPLETCQNKVYHWLLCRPFCNIDEFMANDIVDLEIFFLCVYYICKYKCGCNIFYMYQLFLPL